MNNEQVKEIEQLTKDLVDIQNVPTDYLGVYFPYKFDGIAKNLIDKGYRKHATNVSNEKRLDREDAEKYANEIWEQCATTGAIADFLQAKFGQPSQQCECKKCST